MRALTLLVLHHEPAPRSKPLSPSSSSLIFCHWLMAVSYCSLIVGRLPRLSLIGVPRLRAVRRDI